MYLITHLRDLRAQLLKRIIILFLFVYFLIIFSLDFIYLFLEQGEGREKRKGEKINV